MWIFLHFLIITVQFKSGSNWMRTVRLKKSLVTITKLWLKQLAILHIYLIWHTGLFKDMLEFQHLFTGSNICFWHGLFVKPIQFIIIGLILKHMSIYCWKLTNIFLKRRVKKTNWTLLMLFRFATHWINDNVMPKQSPAKCKHLFFIGSFLK